MITEKKCSRCKEIKPVDCFSKKKSMKSGINSHCKECNSYYIKNWLEVNRLRKQAADREYNRLNRDTIAEKKSSYFKKNFEYFKAKNNQYRNDNAVLLRKTKKQEYARNRDSYIERASWRRAKKLQASPAWLTKEQRGEISDFYAASRIFKLYTGIEYHVDHIVPLQGEIVCGLHVPWNLQILESFENCSKRNRYWPDMPD